jgi:hypothetical protein
MEKGPLPVRGELYSPEVSIGEHNSHGKYDTEGNAFF